MPSWSGPWGEYSTIGVRRSPRAHPVRHPRTTARRNGSGRRRGRTKLEEVEEEPERPGHAGGELPEEREPGVHVRPLAERADQEAAVERGLTGVGQLEQRRVGAVPGVGEVEAALLDPAGPVGRPDPAGP